LSSPFLPPKAAKEEAQACDFDSIPMMLSKALPIIAFIEAKIPDNFRQIKPPINLIKTALVACSVSSVAAMGFFSDVPAVFVPDPGRNSPADGC